MREAWVYATDDGSARALAASLSEIGWYARHVSLCRDQLVPAGAGAVASPSGPRLRPGEFDGGSSRRPMIAIVVAAPGQPIPLGTCAALGEDGELCDVPLLVAVEVEHLADALAAEEAHELIVRPYAPGELSARIARARRSLVATDDEVIRLADLELNLATYQVAIGGRPVDFTNIEYELLKFFVTHPARVFSRETLLSRVWGYDYYGGARTVDVHIRRVRAKLGQEHAARIKTVRGVGYRFES